jgi:hypothetical protein
MKYSFFNNQFFAASFLLLWRFKMGEGPKEIKAEQSHPEEHGNPREVEQVPDGKAGLKGNGDKKFLGAGIVIVRGDLNIVRNHEKESCQKDEEDIGADDFALKLIVILISQNSFSHQTKTKKNIYFQ